MSVRATMKRTWPVLLSYAIFSIWGVCCFVASLVLQSGGFGLEPHARAAVGGILAAVAVGHIVGNILGLAGFRLVPISVLFFAGFMGATMSGVALGPIAIFLVIAVFAAYGGYLGIGSRLDVVASWYPLSLCVGGAIIWMNAHKAIATFNSGSKYALWDAFTIVCLAGGVFWMLVFLATRNALGLTVWQEVARPRMAGDPDVAVARPGRGSLLVLMAFTVVVLGATALISPYLFRTGPGDQDGQSQDDGKGNGKGQAEGDGSQYKGKKTQGQGSAQSKQEGEGHGKGQGKGDGKDGNPAGDPDTDGASEAAAEAAKLGIKILAYLLAVAAILLFLYLVVMPPIRRYFLMRHLEKPLWPVPPTSRVMNQWRRALAVLAVAGVEPSAGETATDFATRAARELDESIGAPSPGLHEAATIVERIHYAGRGLGTSDEATVKAAIDQFVAAVRPRLKMGRRFAAAWGRAPEVEA